MSEALAPTLVHQENVLVKSVDLGNGVIAHLVNHPEFGPKIVIGISPDDLAMVESNRDALATALGAWDQLVMPSPAEVADASPVEQPAPEPEAVPQEPVETVAQQAPEQAEEFPPLELPGEVEANEPLPEISTAQADPLPLDTPAADPVTEEVVAGSAAEPPIELAAPEPEPVLPPETVDEVPLTEEPLAIEDPPAASEAPAEPPAESDEEPVIGTA